MAGGFGVVITLDLETVVMRSIAAIMAAIHFQEQDFHGALFRWRMEERGCLIVDLKRIIAGSDTVPEQLWSKGMRPVCGQFQ